MKDIPLNVKLNITKNRIKEWYEHWNGKVYVAFSGGKDSTVLLHIVRSIYKDTPAVFCNTGLEYPEIKSFVKSVDNVVWLKPKMNFKEILKKYGFPITSKEVSQKIYEIRTTKSEKLMNIRMNGKDNKYKSGKLPNKWHYLIDAPFEISHKCCDYMKKNISKKYEKETGRKPIIGTMVMDSHLRKQSFLRQGCNAFNLKRPRSAPLSLWNEQDIWDYIKQNELKYSSIYDMGYKNTGCMFCMFGLYLDKYPNKFDMMKKTHPKLYNYCMNKLGLKTVIDYLNSGGSR